VTVAVSSQSPFTAQGAPLLSARKKLDVITAYREVGTYRGAAEMCGVTHKTVKRILEAQHAATERVDRRRNYESVRALVVAKVEVTKGKISAKRLLPEATASGYAGSARNFWRLVAQEKARYRHGRPSAAHGGRRSGAQVSTWSSTGACRTACMCSALSLPTRASGSSGSPATNAPRRPWRCSPSASGCWVGSRESCSPTGWGA